MGIMEAAIETGVTVHTLRYYERVGLLPEVPRDELGYRRYREHELAWIEWITMLRDSGMGIQQIRRFVNLVRSGDDTIDARCEILDEHRAHLRRRIDTLHAYLKRLDDKREYYRALQEGDAKPGGSE